MKMRKKLSLLTVLFLLISLCMTGCGGKGKTEDIAGYYKCIRISENGEEFGEYTQLTEYGIYQYLVLDEDGTGYMLSMGEKEELIWDDKEIGDGNSSLQYSYQDGTLTLSDTKNEMVYTKLAGDELEDFIKNGAPDWETLLEEMLTGS